MTNRGKIIFCILILLIAGIIFLIFSPHKKPQTQSPIDTPAPLSISDDDKQALKDTVIAFGSHLKNVPLSGESEQIKKSIKDEYSDFVSPLLLKRWLDDPTHAPGRVTSSPWPERIEITDMYKSGDYYDITGEIILWTSTEATSGNGDAGREPIFLTLIKNGSKWQISEYQTSME